MIQVKKAFSNGMFDCQEIYSDNGKKILETTNGRKHDTIERVPIAIAVKRRADYVEIDEPVDMSAFEEIKKTIEENKQTFNG